jgi:hypothetical protein
LPRALSHNCRSSWRHPDEADDAEHATGLVHGHRTSSSSGIHPAGARLQVTTGSGVEFVPQGSVRKIEALATHRVDFSVLCHTLPPSATVDAVLGLDFMRGQRLIVKLRLGDVTRSNSSVAKGARAPSSVLPSREPPQIS